MKYILPIALLLLSTCGDASAFQKLKEKYYKDMEARKAPVFVSKCGPSSGLSATLYFDINNGTWKMFEDSEGYAVNLVSINFETDGPTLEETNGGVYSMARVSKLIKELTGYGFDLLAPFTMEKLEKLEPRAKKCLNVDE